MREYTHTFAEGIIRGLIPKDQGRYNQEGFIQMDGLFTDEEIIQDNGTPSQLALTSLSCTHPFPQVFKLKTITLVCDETTVYEWDGTSLTSLITVSEGSVWSVADYERFIVMTNGVAILTRDGESGEWAEYTTCEIPTGMCVCNLNGQLLIGGPETTCSAGFMG